MLLDETPEMDVHVVGCVVVCETGTDWVGPWTSRNVNLQLPIVLSRSILSQRCISVGHNL